MQAVEGFSHGYVEGNAWRTPLSWTGKDKWIVAYLKEICRVSANEVANTLSVAFGAAVVEHGGGVAYEPTKADLRDYFGPLARAKDKKGWLAGVPYGPRANERPLRLLYLAPRVVALLRASRGALEPLVLEAYDVAIGADNKAHASAQKSVLKVQYASLVERITAVEMDADDAREAADTSNRGGERGRRAARRRAAVARGGGERARQRSVRQRARARARERRRRHRARCEAAAHGEGDQRRAARERRGERPAHAEAARVFPGRAASRPEGTGGAQPADPAARARARRRAARRGGGASRRGGGAS